MPIFFITTAPPLTGSFLSTSFSGPCYSKIPYLPIFPNKTKTRMSSSPSSPDSITYSSSGVNIDTEAASVKALVTALRNFPVPRKEGENGALVSHPGGFSGLIEFGEQLLALCTDGVGSKLLLPSEMNYYESVALDCVAMNVNDLICVGAEPLAFVDYIAAPKPDPETWSAIGRSLAKACALARVSLCGGETASLPDMMTHIDMSGTALDSLPRDSQLTGEAVRPGDVNIGVPSSGIHLNGYSLVRRVMTATGASFHDPVPFDAHRTSRVGEIWRHVSNGADPSTSSSAPITLGEVVLNPTRIYVDPIIDLIKACRTESGPCPYDAIHGIVHITGGGLSNLLRLNSAVGFQIEDAMPVPPEFDWIRPVGNVSSFETYCTFNMGMGLCLIVSDDYASAIACWFADRLPCVEPSERLQQRKESYGILLKGSFTIDITIGRKRTLRMYFAVPLSWSSINQITFSGFNVLQVSLCLWCARGHM